MQTQFESAVTEMSQDTFVGSSIANGATMITCALRQRDLQQACGAPSPLSWRQEASHVDMHDLSTCHTPMKYRFILAQGAYLEAQNQRLYFPPDIKGVLTAPPLSHRLVRLACSRAVVCGVRRRPIALLFAALFLMPITQASLRRWMDAIGAHVPSPEERLRQRLALTPATECHLDGYSPRGTDHGVLVVQDAHDRILLTHEAASEHGDDARPLLPR